MTEQGDSLDLQKFRRLLYEERDRYATLVQGLSDTGLDEPMTESTGELSSYDQHPADTGNEMYEREKDLGLRADAQVTLGRIEAALERIARSEYGVCASCGRPIGAERLEAIPYAEECVSCSGAHGENEHQRPIEERAVSFVESFTDSDEEVAYDAEDAWQDVVRHGTSTNSPLDALGAVGHEEVFIEGEDNVEVEVDPDLDQITSDLYEDEEGEKDQERERWRR